ncbi:hypothetical protein Micbo1qcDRAFT_203443 [Microdochium bolleyi]|uniref:LPXTG-domain-containing protein n=1 Tax=Microdochium bolleyi TaxID=196109 RepID=A0A136J894_9PEZI|nr:hypothetical protein Micbo1qcDRAFT_203443 [Microdochium bolleyi]
MNEEFSTKTAGIKYQNCMECLQTSNATSHNARYTIDVCLYGFRNESKRVSSPCDVGQSCKSLKTALLAGNLDSSRDIYEYCDSDGGSFAGNKPDSCTQCYSNTDATTYLSNFLVALKAGCKQRPHDGTILGLSNSVFSSTLVEITDPPQNTTPPARDGSSTAMTTGAIVGIAVGGALLLFGGIGLFFVYHRKQKRLYDSNVFIDSDYQDRGDRGRKSASPQPLLVAGGRSSTSTPESKMMGTSIYASRSVANLAEYELASKNYHYSTHSRNSSRGGHYLPSDLDKEMMLGTTKIKPMPTVSAIQVQGHSHSASEHVLSAAQRQQHRPRPSHPTYIPQAHSRQGSGAGISMAQQGPTTSSLYITTTATGVAASAIPQEPQHTGSQQQELDYQPSRWPSPSRNPYAASMSSSRPAPSAPTGAAANTTNPFIARIIAKTQQRSGTSASSGDQQEAPGGSAATATATGAAAAQRFPHGVPPPPPGSKAPDLAMPLVPRVRAPMTYVPPQITIEAASPVERA